MLSRKIPLFVGLALLSVRSTFAQWSSLGLQNENVKCLLIADSAIYAGSSGVYKTVDNGLNWTSVSNGIMDTMINGTGPCDRCITGINATSAGLFATTDDTVYFSNDNAQNWIAIQALDPGSAFNNYTKLYEHNGVLFAKTNNYWGQRSISRSHDNGLTWVSMTDFIDCSFKSNYAYFIKSNGVYISTDNGQNCTLQTGLNLPANPFIECITARDTNEAFIFIVNNGSPYMLSTTDYGATWDSIAPTLPLFFTKLLAADTYLIASYGLQVYISTNMGQSWVSISQGLPLNGSAINDLLLIGDQLYAATDAGVYSLSVDQLLETKETDVFATDILVFPNPTITSLQINSGKSITQIELMDVQGNYLQKWVAGTEELDLSIYPAGIYYVVIAQNETQTLLKVVKK